jgi:hypothetical protein
VSASLSPEVRFLPFGEQSRETYLDLQRPPFCADHALRQLRYVESYARDLHCKSIAVESPYVDRDYMEDHSVFYSKCLHPYPNYCRRVHFFAEEKASVELALERLLDIGIAKGLKEYRKRCRRFSKKVYLGFAVIKPLAGSPVGRTVLRCFPSIPSDATDKTRRIFAGTRRYIAHFAGVQLSVRGLAFQQQDIGVSACATTAIWSALQKVRDHEDIATYTPAQITSLASKYSLPFGRAMPSEGLSIDQMCQAIQAAGVSPSVLRLENLSDAKGYLHTALSSGLAPVLILKKGTSSYHAITVVGMKMRVPRERSLMIPGVDDVAGSLVALYVHDDRKGPYLRANLETRETTPTLCIPSRDRPAEMDVFDITHMIVPVHDKIRLSISNLREFALKAVAEIHQLRELIEKTLQKSFPESDVLFDTQIVRSHKYGEALLETLPVESKQVIAEFCKIPMPRYLAVIRLTAPFLGGIDVLIDTTSTQRNAHCVAVLNFQHSSELSTVFGGALAIRFGCRHIG